jgi:hypothetical protein
MQKKITKFSNSCFLSGFRMSIFAVKTMIDLNLVVYQILKRVYKFSIVFKNLIEDITSTK